MSLRGIGKSRTFVRSKRSNISGRKVQPARVHHADQQQRAPVRIGPIAQHLSRSRRAKTGFWSISRSVVFRWNRITTTSSTASAEYSRSPLPSIPNQPPMKQNSPMWRRPSARSLETRTVRGSDLFVAGPARKDQSPKTTKTTPPGSRAKSASTILTARSAPADAAYCRCRTG